MRGHQQELRRRPGSQGHHAAPRTRHRHRAGRRERRRQVDADEDRQRPVRRRRRQRVGAGHPTWPLATPATRSARRGHRAAGAGVDRGHDGLREPLRRPGIATGPVPEPQGDDRRGQEDACGLRRGHLADRADGQPPGRSAADRGDRQGRPHRRAGRHARRADVGHLRTRGRRPVRDRAPSPRARRRDGLHHPQDGRDPRHRRSGRGAARRRA